MLVICRSVSISKVPTVRHKEWLSSIYELYITMYNKYFMVNQQPNERQKNCINCTILPN